MASKPFSIQAPEEIAKEYAGNKQKIAQAAQMGIVDPTAAVLAGMFIDRMRSAQVMEGAAQPTVAQQVLGGGTPAPAPVNASQGLGANPAGAPPPPTMGMAPPMPAPPMPEMGMADGGLASLPVPDTMFDEPDNGGYAGGGLVAFADGGDIDLEQLRRAIIMQESGGDYGITNREGSGAMGAYQFMPDTARALAKRLGLEYRPDLLAGPKARTKEGMEYQDTLGTAQLQDAIKFSGGDVGRAGIYHFAGPNEEGWGPKTRQYEKDILRRYSGSKDTGDVPERDIDLASGRLGSLGDILAVVQGINRKSPEELEAESRVRARLEEKASDEYYEQQRKADMWQTLAEVGFNMASSKSPYVLQAIGEAAAAAMPGARADKKERKELKDRALEGLMELGARNRKEAMEGLKIAIPIWQAGMSAEQAEEAMAFQKEEFAWRKNVSEQEMAMAREKLNAEIAALQNKGADVNTSVFRMFMSGDRAMKEAAKEWLRANGKGMSPLIGEEGDASAAGPWTQYQ